MQLDPRTTLVATSLLILTTFLTTQPEFLLGLCCLLLISLCVSHTPFSRFVRHLVWLSWLLIFTFLAHLAGNLSSIQQGIRSGAFRVGQLSIAVGWVTLLGANTSPFALIHGLDQMCRPLQRLGLPLQKLTLVTMLSIRFLPLLAQEGEQLVHASIARGMDLANGSLLIRLKHYELLCIPLFSNMLRRVEHIATAMDTRAFDACSERTSLQEFRLCAIDYLVLAGSLFIILVL